MVICNCLLSNPITANIDLTGVTSAQLGAAHKILSSQGNYYLVENSEGRLDDAGELEEYKVTFEHGHITCTCKAGKAGFANCRNFCWHVRAALACEREEQQAMAEIAIAQATAIIKKAQAPKQEPQEPTIEQVQAVAQDIRIDGKPADIATVYRVMTAEPKKTNKHQKGISSRPFSLMR